MTQEHIGPTTPEEEATPADDASQTPDEAPGEEMEALRGELEEVKQQHLRALADYQNLQRRAAEERQEFGRYQLVSLVLNFLPVLDDLQRAVDAAEAEDGEQSSWVEGVRLVEQKFRGVLESAGVQEIHALNQPFNPELHEAVGSAPGPEGRVVHLVQRGYTLQDRVIRAAMVVVGNGEDTGAATAESSEQPGEASDA